MSDTSGATDLSQDMPGLGAAPPATGIARSPLRLPSALQALIGSFTQPQGPPAQQFRPPPPPRLTEEQARQPPPQSGRPGSISPAPPNVPPPPRSFSPFIGAQDSRDPSQWGDPVNYPRLPATFELPGMFGQLGNYFLQNGSYGASQAAAELLGANKDQLEGFMKGQEWQMRMAREKIALKLDQLNLQAVQDQTDFKDIYNEYLSAAGGDKHKLANVTLDGMNLYDAMHAKAAEIGNQNLMRMFENGEPLEHVFDYLARHDKMIRDLEAAKKAATNQDSADAIYGLKPQDSAAEPWDEPSPSAPASADDTATAAKPAAEVPEVFKNVKIDGKPITPEMAAAATLIYKGIEPKDLPKDVLPYAGALARMMDVETNKILSDPNIKPGEYGEAIRKRLGTDPASELKGIEDYTIDPNRGSQQKELDYMHKLAEIAAKDIPARPAEGIGGWTVQNFSLQKDFKDNRGQVQNVLTRTGDMASQLRNVHDDLDRLQKEIAKKGYGPNDIDLEGAIKLLTGTGVANRVMSDLEAYSAAYDFVVSNGHSTLGGREAFSRYFSIRLPISTIRDTLKGHVPSTFGILQGIHRRWEGMGGKKDDMPGLDAATEKEISDYGKQDINTGALPYDPNRDNDIFKKNAGPWGPAGNYYWTGESQERDDPRNWKRVE